MMNGREITITWRGELKDDRLTFRRQLGGGPEMSPHEVARLRPTTGIRGPVVARTRLGGIFDEPSSKIVPDTQPRNFPCVDSG